MSKGICQLDGNESLEEEDLESVSNIIDESEDETGPEDPPPWHDPYTKEQEPRLQTLRRINTNNRVAISSEMPTIASTNTRSILPKIRHFFRRLNTETNNGVFCFGNLDEGK